MTAPAAAPHLPPPTPLRRNLVFGAIATAVVLGYVGDALWGSLIDRSPLALLLLNAKPRYQIMVANELALWVFFPVALARLLCTKPLVWLVGAWYGPRTTQWIDNRAKRTGRLVRWAQKHFPTRGWMVMIITTSNPVCLLAGSVGYPLSRLMLWAVIGTSIRLYAVVVVADQFSDLISSFTDWVVDHRILVVAVSITVVVVGLLLQRRRGLSPLSELQELEDAVEDAYDDELEAAAQPDGEPAP